MRRRDRSTTQAQHHTNDSITPDLIQEPVENSNSQNHHEQSQEHALIARATTRKIFAWETGPPPHEIERGFWFHLASYICFCQCDPNINPAEDAVHQTTRLAQSANCPAQTNSRFLEALGRLSVTLHLRKPPLATTTAPLSTGVQPISSPHASIPLSNQSPPTIAIAPPMDTTEVSVYPLPIQTSPSPTQTLLSPARVDPNINIDPDGAQSGTGSNPWQHIDTEPADRMCAEFMCGLSLEDPWRDA
ncbi:hypothetical protein BS17DRAFT_525700 [Gyrodon lividus]|nr:hypothetical protein BS17DRAFT_525700 [Gyrodon lividus]